MPVFEKPEDAENGLTTLLLRAAPVNDRGNKTLTEIARIIGVTRWGMRKWVNAKKIKPEWVLKVVEASKIQGYTESGEPILGEARVDRAEFESFVYKD